MPTNIEIIKELFEAHPLNCKIKASELVGQYYDYYLKEHGSNPSVNGAIFEELITIALIKEGITPVYSQVELAFVPNVIFDLLIYNRQTPVSLSAKVSLRERWKQADLEATALKFVHRKAKAYVITLSESEVLARRKDLNSYIGLDGFILANSAEFDNLIIDLKNHIVAQENESVSIITNADKKRVDKAILQTKYSLDWGVN